MGEMVLLVVILIVLAALSLAMYLPEDLLPASAALLPLLQWMDWL